MKFPVFIRQSFVFILRFILGNLTPEQRKIVGSVLVGNRDRLILQKVLEWYLYHRPIDAYLISFPKCGRTWLRLMIGHFFVNHFDLTHHDIRKRMLKLEPLSELHPVVPRIRVSHDDNPHWKTSEELIEIKSEYRNAKVIFLVRDPRDVVVSAYFERKKRAALWDDDLKMLSTLGSEIYAERIKPFQGNLSTFLYDDVGSLKTCIRFYNIWADNRTIPKDFLLVRFEDLHEDPQRELLRVLSFMGVSGKDSEIISEAIRFTSFENMRRMEIEDVFKSRNLQPADIGDEESFKTRKGEVGGYTDYFSKDKVDFMDQYVAHELSDFYGY